MRRTLLLLVGVLLSVVVLGSNSPKEYDDRVTMDELQGEWRLITFEHGEMTVNLKRTSGDALTFRASKWERSSISPVEAGIYNADASLKPAHLDRTHMVGEKKGKTERLIYCIDGDILRIAERLNENNRPGSFNDHGLFIFTYKRVK